MDCREHGKMPGYPNSPLGKCGQGTRAGQAVDCPETQCLEETRVLVPRHLKWDTPNPNPKCSTYFLTNPEPVSLRNCLNRWLDG